MEQQQYEHESQSEDYADYGPDGYHPVALGQKFNYTYTIIQKLGWGHFSTVWLVQNEKTKKYAALKIQKSKQSHSQSAIDEMKILNEIMRHKGDKQWIDQLQTIQKLHPEQINQKLCSPLLLYDTFCHYGIHGKHYCSVFEILGPNLLDVIQHYQFKKARMPLWFVKKITIDVLLGLVYLHQYCDIIHTDLKPQNIMIKMQQQQQQQFIQNLKKYKIKPISMKYLKNIQSTKNIKNKKKNEKKKLKKKLKKFLQQGQKQQLQLQKQSSQQQHQQNILVLQNQQYQNISSNSNNWQNKSQQPVKQQQKQNNDQCQLNYNLQQNQDQPEIDMKYLQWKNVKIQLNNKIFFKIVDMGNACFANHHFTQDIQTRQYRSPQVILGYSYSHNTDIWSLACTVFQLLTNAFLFKPSHVQGISQDQDHLFKILQILGPMSKQYSVGGLQSLKFFTKKGKLIHGNPKQQLTINKLLHQDYGYTIQDSLQIQQFLLPMLIVEDQKRINARQCLKSKWLWK